MRTYRNQRGFTLVEILIVVIILGILAAVVIPQFTSASEDARESSTRSQLQTIRSQIELYKLQHRDQLPNLVGGEGVAAWAHFTSKTDEDGVIGTTVAHRFGPYMQTAPRNPLNGLDTIANGTGASSTEVGFVYDYGTAGDGSGRIWATGRDKKAFFVE
jgi:general secretion pathway protein G